MLPGLEVVSVYVSCYIFLSVVNVESWPHQILRLTVLSTNRVILLWILRPTVLSTNRVILLWILRPTVLSTIYQVMLVVIIQHNESCDSTSIYCGFYVWLLPRLKVVSMYVLCYWLSVVNEKAAHTPDSTSDCLIYYKVMLPGLYCISVVIMIKCERFYSYLLCIVVLLAVMI